MSASCSYKKSKSQRGILLPMGLSLVLQHGDPVGAEGGNGEAAAGVEGTGGVVGPAVAYMDGMGNGGAADDDGCAIGMGIGYVPLAVGVLNGEAGEVLSGKEVIG